MTAPSVTVSDTPPGCVPGGEWLPLTKWGYSKYELWSAGGQGRDQRPVRNKTTGALLSVGEGTQKRNTHRRGYLQTKLYNDQGERKTIAVHILVLLVNAGPPPEGMQTRHLDNNPWNNQRGNLIYGTPPEQHADMVAAGTAVPPPTVECVNYVRCGGVAVKDGSRCVPCMTEVGGDAAKLLAKGMHRADVAVELGYQATSGPYVEGLAVSFGGYVKPSPQARPRRRAPKRTLRQRVTGWFKRAGRK